MNQYKELIRSIEKKLLFLENKISRTIFLLNSSSGNNYSLVQKLDDLEDQRDELMFELDELTEFDADFEEVVSKPLLLNQKKIIG